jgi:hypothetical protein
VQRLREDLAKLPAPVLLTPEQLVAVAAGTGAMLRAGGGIGPVIVAGGIISTEFPAEPGSVQSGETVL